jgi:hypothetical protein
MAITEKTPFLALFPMFPKTKDDWISAWIVMQFRNPAL